MRFIGLVFSCLCCWQGVWGQSLWQQSMNFLRQDHRWLPLPILYRSPETSWAAGASLGYYFKLGDSSSTSNLQLQAVYTLRQQLISRWSGEVFGPDNGYYAYGYLSYRQYFDRFYGIGPMTRLSDREDFSYRSWVSWGGWLWAVYPNLYAGGQYRFQHMYDLGLSETGHLAQNQIAGSNGSTTWGLGPEVIYDTRDKVQSPRSGWRVQAGWRWHPAWFAETTAFGFGQIDGRHYHLVQPQVVWAKRLLFRQVQGTAPFREMAMAGGSDFARGYFEGRFRDNCLLGIENEWRWQMHQRLAWNFFITGFQVAPERPMLFQHPWRWAYGTGWRIFVNPEERVALRLDLARTSEGSWGFYLDLSEAF